ncbi:MAG: Ig-like domain-containing protein, partial [Endozoicomonadaceae bacterium]|nr:Ig-like domain-containing protein [Endozoicomonadaceae bacterium]
MKIPCISQSLFILSILLYASNANAEISCPASDITDTTISGNMRGLDVSDTDCSVLDHNVSDYNSAATFPTSIFPFSAFLPDLSSGQTVARFAMHTGSTIATFSSATCSGATITGIDTLVLDVELNNGDSCTLKFGANSDDQGFSGATLSRSGSIYSLTAGTLSGGPYGGTFVVADSTPPTLSTLSPADNATDISTTANLVITLSENAAKGTGNILIKKTADDSTAETIDVTSGLVTISGAVVTINPSITLDSNTEYYVQIPATALDDSSGNSYAGITDTTSWSFTTLDNAAPTLSTLSPADNATDVSTTANLVITLSENAAKGAGNILIKKTSDDSTAETIDVTSGLVTIGGAVVTINPSITLDSNTEYYVQIPATALDDSSGNSYAGITDTTSWSFTTLDNAAPTLSTLSPADNATDVSTTANLVITL